MTLVISLGDEVPQSVRDKAKAVADAGGMTALKKLMDELPELLTRNTEILDECERMLKEEDEGGRFSTLFGLSLLGGLVGLVVG